MSRLPHHPPAPCFLRVENTRRTFTSHFYVALLRRTVTPHCYVALVAASVNVIPNTNLALQTRSEHRPKGETETIH
jgi:hypothetical protein